MTIKRAKIDNANAATWNANKPKTVDLNIQAGKLEIKNNPNNSIDLAANDNNDNAVMDVDSEVIMLEEKALKLAYQIDFGTVEVKKETLDEAEVHQNEATAHMDNAEMLTLDQIAQEDNINMDESTTPKRKNKIQIRPIAQEMQNQWQIIVANQQSLFLAKFIFLVRYTKQISLRIQSQMCHFILHSA